METQTGTGAGQSTGNNIFSNYIGGRHRQLNAAQNASLDRINVAAKQLFTAISEEIQGGGALDQSAMYLANCVMWAELGITTPVTGKVGGAGGGTGSGR